MRKYKKLMKSNDQSAKVEFDEKEWINHANKIRGTEEYKQLILYYYEELKDKEKIEYDHKYIKSVNKFMTKTQQNKSDNHKINISDICKNNPKAYMDYKRRNMRIIKDYIEELEFQTKIISMKDTEKKRLRPKPLTGETTHKRFHNKSVEIPSENIVLSDFEKEMKKNPTYISDGNDTPTSNRSLYHNLFRSQMSSNSLESVFLDSYIKRDPTSKAKETVKKNSMIVESIGFRKNIKSRKSTIGSHLDSKEFSLNDQNNKIEEKRVEEDSIKQSHK